MTRGSNDTKTALRNAMTSHALTAIPPIGLDSQRSSTYSKTVSVIPMAVPPQGWAAATPKYIFKAGSAFYYDEQDVLAFGNIRENLRQEYNSYVQ